MKLKTILGALSGFIFALAVVVGLTLSNDAKATGPYVTFSSFSGHAGSAIKISGGGFGKGETVNFSFANSSKPAGAAITDGFGNFKPIEISIPSTAASGNLNISATGQTSGQSASNFYYVQPYFPSISIKALGTIPTAPFTMAGNNFMPGETVAIDFAGTQLSAQADAKGAFTLKSTIPAVGSESYNITATGANSQSIAKATFYVGGFYPDLTPSRFFINPTDPLTLSAHGFMPGENVDFYIGYAGAPFATFKADSKGNLINVGPFSSDFSTAGKSLSFTAMGQQSHARVTASVSVGKLNAQLNAAPYFVNPSYSISMWGTGFGKGEKVNIFDAADPSNILASELVDKNGDWTGASIKVPYSDAGTTRTFHAVGSSSGADTTVQINVGQLYPQIIPSAYFVKSAQEMKFFGYGFAPGENVDLSVNGKLLMVVTADKKTNITSDPLVVPFANAFTVTATGELSGVSTSVTLKPTAFKPYVQADQYYVYPGSKLSFAGADFAPNEDIQLTMGQSSKVLETLHADADGKLTDNSMVFPFGTSGSTAFNFHGTKSDADASVTVSTAKFIPWIESKSYFAAPQQSVQVLGHGFAPGEVVRINAGPSSVEAPTNLSGDTPQITLKVPYGVGNDGLKITFTGESSQSSANTLIGVKQYLPSIAPSTYYLAQGQNLKVQGFGFAPNEPVKVSVNFAQQAEVTTDAKGNLASPLLQVLPGLKSVHLELEGELSRAHASADVEVAQPLPSFATSKQP